MSFKNLKVKSVVSYGGHSLKQSGAVTLTFNCEYPELTNTILLMQAINNDVMIKVKELNKKPIKLGVFRIQEIKVKSYGDSVIKFTSINDFVEMNNLNAIADTEYLTALFESEIELEEE